MTPGAPPSLARRLLRGAGTVFAVQVAGTALGYLGQLALARWLGVSGYGRFAYVHTWSLLLANLAGLGLTPAALRFLPTYIERGEGRRYARFLAQACGWALGLSLLIALAILALARAGALGQHSEAWLAGAWLVPVFAMMNLHTQEGRTQGRLVLAMAPPNLLKYALLILSAGALLAVTGGPSARQLLAVFAGSMALLVLGQGLALRRSRAALPDGESAAGLLGEWMRVGTPLLLILVFMNLMAQADVLLVGSMLGDDAVGVYNAASRTAATVGFALFAVNAAAAPSLAALHATGRREELARLLAATSRWTFWPALAIALGFALAGKVVLGFFGAEFTRAYLPLLILCGGQLAAASVGLAGSLLNLTGHERLSASLLAGAAALNLLLNGMLIPRFGLPGAAVATTAALVVWSLALRVAARRRLGFDPFVLAGRSS